MVICGDKGDSVPGGDLVPENECWVRPEIWVQDNWYKSSEKVTTLKENGDQKWLKVKNQLR